MKRNITKPRVRSVDYVETRKRKDTNGVHIKALLFFNTSYL